MTIQNGNKMKLGFSLLLLNGCVYGASQDMLRDNPGLNTATNGVACAMPASDLFCLNTNRDRISVFSDLTKGWSVRDLGTEETTQTNGDKLGAHAIIGKSGKNYYYIGAFWTPGNNLTSLVLAGPKSTLLNKILTGLAMNEARMLVRSITTDLAIYSLDHDSLPITPCQEFVKKNSLPDLKERFDSVFFQRILECNVRQDNERLQITLASDQGIKLYSDEFEIHEVKQLPDLGGK